MRRLDESNQIYPVIPCGFPKEIIAALLDSAFRRIGEKMGKPKDAHLRKWERYAWSDYRENGPDAVSITSLRVY